MDHHNMKRPQGHIFLSHANSHSRPLWKRNLQEQPPYFIWEGLARNSLSTLGMLDALPNRAKVLGNKGFSLIVQVGGIEIKHVVGMYFVMRVPEIIGVHLIRGINPIVGGDHSADVAICSQDVVGTHAYLTFGPGDAMRTSFGHIPESITRSTNVFYIIM